MYLSYSNDSKKVLKLTSSSSKTKEYSIDNGQSFQYTIVPTLNSFNTSVKISYRTDGTKDSEAKIFEEIN